MTFVLLIAFLLVPGNVDAARIRVKKGGKTTYLKGSIVKVIYKGCNDTENTNTNQVRSNGLKSPSTVKPLLIKIDGEIYASVKRVFCDNGIGAKFLSSGKKVILRNGKRKIKYTAGSKYAHVNGKKMKLKKRPFMVTYADNGEKDILVPVKQAALYLGMSYDHSSGKVTLTKRPNIEESVTKASQIKKSAFIKTIGPMARRSYKRTKILASVTIAQAILESGWGKSYVARKGNNLFGIKKGSSRGWKGTAYDGINTVGRHGSRYRKYSCVEDSIEDHGYYLANCGHGRKRYAGITKTKSYRRQLQIIVRGGYCTSGSYVGQLCHIIQRYHLTKYDRL